MLSNYLKEVPLWPVWAIFQVLDSNFSYKSYPNICWFYKLIRKTQILSQFCFGYFLSNLWDNLSYILFQHLVALIVYQWSGAWEHLSIKQRISFLLFNISSKRNWRVLKRLLKLSSIEVITLERQNKITGISKTFFRKIQTRARLR